MMSSAVLRLVVLISCAHALVHVYELSLPSVEQEIADNYFPADQQAGKNLTGWLSTCWRVPWGLGALGAGWLVDRFGAKRLLAIYLLGCTAMCALAGLRLPTAMLFVAMFSMGAFASIYHPAGLALISHETGADNRARALGLHGIFGSAGIGAAPFLAATMFAVGLSWQQYYWGLMIPGAILGIVFLWQARTASHASHGTEGQVKNKNDDQQASWPSYFTLTFFAMLQGFVYSGMMSFLPRYLSYSQPSWLESRSISAGNYFACGVLLIGCVGQYVAGRIARPRLLEIQLSFVTFGNAPFLIWMAVASEWNRVLAAGLFSLIHFMNQPLYNSLIAKYTPRRRRSLCYGFSFAMAFGVGGFGARFAGASQSNLIVYVGLAIVAIVGGCVGLLLWGMNRGEAATNLDR